VKIVPVATVGGHDTVFVLSECRSFARLLGLKALLRSDVFPLVLGVPFGLALEAVPLHLPLPAKIRTAILEPVEIDADPKRERDELYIEGIYRTVERRIQEGVDELARRRRFPIFG
jgi:hypothetical protein